MSQAIETQSDKERWTLKAWTDQRTPALAIVARGDQIRALGPKAYSVRSQSHPELSYTVTENAGRWSCECDFYSATSMTCIHIVAVRYKVGFEESAPVIAEAKIMCDGCGSAEVTCHSVRHNKSGDVQRYSCASCGRRFVGRVGFNRRANPMNIARALDLYFRGMSVRKVREHLEQVERLRVSHMTVFRWVVHYSKLAAEWMDAQGARTSDRWHVDETVVDVNGRNGPLERPRPRHRFLLATHISEDRSLANARVPLAKAKRATPDRPVDVLTDGMTSYPEAVSKELGRRATPLDDPKLVHGSSWYSPHRRVPSIRAPESNNRIERFHGTEKERFKVMRAFDGKPGTAALAEGLRVHYNLVRDHQALGKTPGEAAGIPVGNGFRWRTIIETAVKAKARVVTTEDQKS